MAKTSKAENPFQAQLVQMRIPEGMGEQISIGGFLLEADQDDRTVTLPRDLVTQAQSHGLVLV